MTRLIRLTLVLGIAYAAGKLVVDIGADGMLTDARTGWLAIPFIALIQATVLMALTRRTKRDEGGKS